MKKVSLAIIAAAFLATSLPADQKIAPRRNQPGQNLFPGCVIGPLDRMKSSWKPRIQTQ